VEPEEMATANTVQTDLKLEVRSQIKEISMKTKPIDQDQFQNISNKYEVFNHEVIFTFSKIITNILIISEVQQKRYIVMYTEEMRFISRKLHNL
jgi:hypothetical protein